MNSDLVHIGDHELEEHILNGLLVLFLDLLQQDLLAQPTPPLQVQLLGVVVVNQPKEIQPGAPSLGGVVRPLKLEVLDQINEALNVILIEYIEKVNGVGEVDLEYRNPIRDLLDVLHSPDKEFVNNFLFVDFVNKLIGDIKSELVGDAYLGDLNDAELLETLVLDCLAYANELIKLHSWGSSWPTLSKAGCRGTYLICKPGGR